MRAERAGSSVRAVVLAFFVMAGHILGALAGPARILIPDLDATCGVARVANISTR